MSHRIAAHGRLGRTLSIPLLAFGLFSCAADRATTSALPQPSSPVDALTALRGGEGPVRFSRVDTSLFRGGAPTPEHLRQLKELGVTTIVDLRRESPGSRRAEELEAHELGLRYVAYPFFGVFGADTHFLDDLIATLATRSEGAVYVHCDDGRERTSLAVALFRVVAQGWAPDDAWVTEAQAYGARRTGMFREIELTFRDHVHQHQVRSRS